MPEALETDAPPLEESSWKLVKETLPPGWQSEVEWRNSVSAKERGVNVSARYFAFLFDQASGLFGFRPGNRWRLSPRKWMERFVWIQDKHSGRIIPLVLNSAQRALMAEIVRMMLRGDAVRVIILKARQEGMSTFVCALLLYLLLTVPNTRAMLMGHKKDSAKVIHGRLSRMIQEVKKKDGTRWQLPLETDNRLEITFEFPFHSTALVDSAEGPDYRGDTLRFFHAIEPAEWPKAEDKANAVMNMIPDAPGTFIFIEGTARGETGWFAESWKSAWKRQQYGESALRGTLAVFYPWFIHDKYRWSAAHGRDLPETIRSEIEATLTEEEQRLLQMTYMRRGVGRVHIDYDQLAWRRHTINEKCQGRIEFFHQEFPSCLVGETRVSTNLGIVRIDAVNGRFRETETGRIVAFGPQPDSDLWTLTTECGRAITGTADHPVKLAAGGFAWLAELREGAEIELSPPRFAETRTQGRWSDIPGIETTLTLTAEWARFLGYFMGDGSWHKDTISIVCDAKDVDVQADVGGLLAALVGQPHARKIARVQGRKGAVEWRVSRRAARDPLQFLGCLGANGGGAWKRRVCIPEGIWRSPKPIVREFLRGLFESDGWARAQGVGIGFCKLDMIRDVQLLLLGFGINARIVSSKKRAGNGSEYEFHRIDLAKEESRRFVEEIGFVGKRKRAFRFEKKAGRGSAERGARPMVDHVARVEKTGHGKTYDLTIEGSHVFGANGILTHNTPDEAFLSSGLRFFSAKQIALAREKYSGAPAWKGDTLDPEGEAKMMLSLPDLEAELR